MYAIRSYYEFFGQLRQLLSNQEGIQIVGDRFVFSSEVLFELGSADLAPDALDGLDVRLVRHAANKGKGAAIRTGAHEAAAQGMTHIITIDADGQHDVV